MGVSQWKDTCDFIYCGTNAHVKLLYDDPVAPSCGYKHYWIYYLITNSSSIVIVH